MRTLFVNGEIYERAEYKSEADLEQAILHVSEELFGEKRIYLDVKRLIGRKGQKRNIPDGYLIDLASRKPNLYVVENELASHEPLRHIAVQLLEFSLSFDSDPRLVKDILFETLQALPEQKQMCQQYAQMHGYRNLDYLLDVLVHDNPFEALVIIDEIPERLRNVLARKFRFGIEVIELARFASADGQYAYQFEPLLSDVSAAALANDPQATSSSEPPRELVDLQDVDTIVVAARDQGFEETFLGENRWYAIRINGLMIPQLEYIAVYRTRPQSAVTHVAPIQSIEPWEDTDKYVVNFAEPADKIEHIPGGSRRGHIQNIMYTTFERLEAAETLDDL